MFSFLAKSCAIAAYGELIKGDLIEIVVKVRAIACIRKWIVIDVWKMCAVIVRVMSQGYVSHDRIVFEEVSLNKFVTELSLRIFL